MKELAFLTKWYTNRKGSETHLRKTFWSTLLPRASVKMRQLDSLLHTFLNNPSFKLKFVAAELEAMNVRLDEPRNVFSNGGSDEASRPINHLECEEMLAETEQTLSLTRQDIVTNSVCWRNVVCTRRPGLYHNMSTSLISIMVARTNIGISTYAWAETIIALLSVPYLLNIEKQDDA